MGDVIPDEASLRVATPELLQNRFGIDVRTNTEALSINPEEQTVTTAPTVTLSAFASGTPSQTEGESPSAPTETLHYDYLVVATGAKAIVPPWPGVDEDGVFILRTIPHARVLRQWISDAKARVDGERRVRVGIVGAGFIGLELADSLVESGVEATVIEFAPQIMPPMDPEMAALLHTRVQTAAGDALQMVVNDGVCGIIRNEEQGEGGAYTFSIATNSGASYDADLVVISIGVKPESSLAKAAGLALGPRGAIAVDASFRTSDPRIFAVGDVAQTADRVTGQPMSLALAGPANRAGRIVADVIASAGKPASCLAVRSRARLPGTTTLSKGVLATWVCGVFGFVSAGVGASQRTLDRAAASGENMGDTGCAYVIAGHHVGYYPGARKVFLKLHYSKIDGRILGAQAVGEEGVERRIDVIATTMAMGGSVYDLVDLELAYAPKFGAARDLVNMLGMVAANDLDKVDPLVHWGKDGESGSVCVTHADLVLDVRSASEVESTPVPDMTTVHIPLHDLRALVIANDTAGLASAGLPVDFSGVIGVLCAVGRRAHVASTLLRDTFSLDARTISGGISILHHA